MTSTFPGMYTSILPFDTFHKGIAPRSRQHMYIYSAIGEEPSPPDANLEACAHLYHSDRESVWSIMRQYELLEVLDIASSLSHTVIFHTGPDKIKFHDTRGRRWFYLETGSERVGDGRGLHKGRIYDRDGNHIASTIQDGAIRLKWKNEEQRRLKEERMNSDAKL
jgi:acyl-CoA thioesterase II